MLSEVQYERYRELIHNDFRGVDQKMVLSEIAAEESFEKMAKKLDKKREQRAAINVQYNQGDKSKPKGKEKSCQLRVIFCFLDGSDSDDSGSDSDPGIALLEDVMNPTLLSSHDQSSVDNRAMDFGIAPGMFIRYLRNDRLFLDSKRQKQKEDIEHAMSGEKKSRRGKRKRRDKKLKSIIISELPSFSQQNVSVFDFSRSLIMFQNMELEEGEMSDSSSDSSEEDNEGEVQKITSFGGSSEDEAQEMKEMDKAKKKARKKREKEREKERQRRKEEERERRKRRSRSRSRSPRRRRRRSRSRSRSRSRR